MAGKQIVKCSVTKKDKTLCRNNAMKGANYCYIHSFGKFRGVPLLKNSTLHLIAVLGFLITVYSLFSGATKINQKEMLDKLKKVPKETADLISKDKLDVNKISLGLRYAYEFDYYLGASNAFGNEDRKIDPRVPLQKRYSPDENVKFVFVVFNENKGIPFDNIMIEVILPEGVLEVIYGKGWLSQRINKRYTYNFLQITVMPLNTYSPISIKFPNKGEYTIDCYIYGKGIDKIHVPVTLQLY